MSKSSAQAYIDLAVAEIDKGRFESCARQIDLANALNLHRIADSLEHISGHTEGLRNWAENNWSLGKI